MASFQCYDLTSKIERQYTWSTWQELKQHGDNLKEQYNFTVDASDVVDRTIQIKDRLIFTFQCEAAAMYAIWLWQA